MASTSDITERIPTVTFPDADDDGLMLGPTFKLNGEDLPYPIMQGWHVTIRDDGMSVLEVEIPVRIVGPVR